MANLKFVVLSDLHLGAAYSILKTSVLDAFGPAVRTLASTLRGVDAPAPQLVLLGDVLDLGLSSVEDVACDFDAFAKALFPSGVPPAFSPEVLYVPGNHDHAIWRWTEDDRYVQQMEPGMCLAFEPVTPLFPAPGDGPNSLVSSRFVTRLLAGATGLRDATVRVAYPNLGYLQPNGRCLVFHHGHFIESLYRMMSDLRRTLGLGGAAAGTVAELEKENAAWMDFVWSTLGDAGLFGQDVGRLYFLLQSGSATERFIRRLARRLVHRFQGKLPMGGELEVDAWARRATRALLDVVLQFNADVERNSYDAVLTQDSIDGLSWYLETPVARQFPGALPANLDLIFAFGHTHKPFEDALPLPSYTRPVRLFNLGGWVLDEPAMASLEGAALLLVDDDLNVVSLRLFNQSAEADARKVRVLPSGSYPQTDNPLLDAVRNVLATMNWDTFTTAVEAALAARQREVIKEFDLGSDASSDRSQRRIAG